VHTPTGTAIEEVVVSAPKGEIALDDHDRALQQLLLRGGKLGAELPDLAGCREHLQAAMVTLPWDGLKLSRGEPAIPTRMIS
jgi:nicotinate phosphoribosyltransferase